MEHEIKLTITLRESDFITELLGKCDYGEGSDVRQSFADKLEVERLKALELIIIGGEKHG